ncbi:hypothetical protein AX16_002645 [Volvariella volvacea WC 439]|nr:hypothetical protein AX16_002645 [Volvariella volvacea WC 439]
MSSNLKAYLAEKYMSGPKADAILAKVGGQKKKKRKTEKTPTAPVAETKSMVVDDDSGWGDESKDAEDDIAEAVVEKDRGFKKRKVAPGEEGNAGWITVQEGILDEIKREQAERERTPPPTVDEQPMIVDATGGAVTFSGGLVTAKDLKRVMPQSGASELEEANKATAEEVARAQETVYRDTSGRKIDTKAAKAEAARLKREREEKEAKKMEWGKGLIQKEEEEKRRQELEKQKDMPFARRADDKEMNEELKAKELWNDPAAAFLTKKKSKGPRRPEYTGPPPPPNRFGIKPGYRWDGVDRSNGFERKLFQSLNERKRKTNESYQWSVDDM